MTYKRQMEKAIKEYLTSLGFKYYAKTYAYYKAINEDLTARITWADETHFRSHYFYLRTKAAVSSKKLNEIILEATDGLYYFRYFLATPAYLLTLNGVDPIHTEFTGELSIEENIAGFDRMFRKEITPVFEKYNTTKSVMFAPIKEPFFNGYNTPSVWFYLPLAYYLNGEYDKAIIFIDEQIEILKEAEEEILEKRGKVSEEFLKDRRAYIIYKENLKKWIAEGRQFEIDGEYLPVL